MILADIIALYRLASHDSATPPFCSDDEVIDFINEAEEQACIRKSLIFDKTSLFCEIAIAAGTSVYALDDSILSIRHATLTDSGGVVDQLSLLDHEEMDRLDASRRTVTDRPTGIIHMDGTVETNYIPDAAYTLNLEVYRLPITKNVNDSPEIIRAHHRHLLDWVLYRAYGKQDGDLFNAEKAAISLNDFEKYFGAHPGAELGKSNWQNTPHRNKGYY
jgi:hypothetical protein